MGHARGHNLSVGFLKNCAMENWGSIVSNPTVISRLAKIMVHVPSFSKGIGGYLC